jgi:pimeloyl-ACP methyl ester carboxylesterase
MRLFILIAVMLACPMFAAVPTTKPAFGVTVVGSGPPMILIPGLACSGEVWRATAEQFKSRYECHLITPAGFADQPPTGERFLEPLGSALVDYIRERRLDRPIIVGHSIGGLVAYSIASRKPECIGPLIIVDAVPCMAAFGADRMDAAALKLQGEAVEREMTSLPRPEFLARQRKLVGMWIKDKAQRSTVVQWTERSDQPSIARAAADMFSCNLHDEVAGITSPVLLIAVAHPDVQSGTRRSAEQLTALYQRQVEKIPKVQVATTTEARHFVMIDQPHWLWKQMQTFLAQPTNAEGR